MTGSEFPSRFFLNFFTPATVIYWIQKGTIMKKICFILSLIISVTALSAQDVAWGSMYGNGNLRFGIDAAYESNGANNHIALYPEAEVLLWKPLIGNLAFLDLGAGIKGRAGIPITAGTDFTAGAGVVGSLHLGFRGFDFPGGEYLANLDYFADAGLKFDFISSGSTFGAVLSTGINYYINDNVAVGAFYSNWGGSGGGGISISIKLGKTPVVSGLGFEIPEVSTGFAVEPYLLQFYTLYYAANFAGGHYPDSYSEGQGSVHRISVMDSSGTESYTVEEILLQNMVGGRSLWGLRYIDEDEQYYYEYVVDSENMIETVYYNSPDDGVVTAAAMHTSAKEEGVYTWDDYEVESREGVSVNVEAGEFITTEHSWLNEDGGTVTWWISPEVTGGLVSYRMQDRIGHYNLGAC